MRRSLHIALLALATGTILMAGCGKSSGTGKKAERPVQSTAVLHPANRFSADSAYKYIAEQVAMGPRVPGTAAHAECQRFIVGHLRESGADTIVEQRAKTTTGEGTIIDINNIWAQFNGKSDKRVLLVAHYDTRPWADMDPQANLRDQPIPGANDGGSGVGVILEIARNLAAQRADVGVDMLFVDAEDMGRSDGFERNDETWCLGSQYWCAHMPYTPAARPEYGILLDMVGGKNARFHRELISHREARTPLLKVWSEANSLGRANRFVNSIGPAVLDDHVFINRAGIPTIDIIECVNDATGTFSSTWHTHADNVNNIDKSTLKDVGEVVLNVLYKEK